MNYIGVSILGYESKEKYPIYVSKNTFRRHVNLLLKEEEGERHFFLSLLFVIILSLLLLLVQQKYQKVMLTIVLKLMVNKWFRYLKKMNTWDSKTMKRK